MYLQIINYTQMKKVLLLIVMCLIQFASFSQMQNSEKIQSPPPLTAQITTTNVSCSGTCDGVVDITGVGGVPPYTYKMEYVGSSTSVIAVNMPVTGLCPGSHVFYIIDSNNSIKTTTVILNSNNTLAGATASLIVTDATCPNSYNGSIYLNINGTNPGPFTYNWWGHTNNKDLNQYPPGIYIVTIYDAAMNCMSLIDTIKSGNVFCGSISGNIYIDDNTDCVKNSGDVNCPAAGVIINPGNHIGYTNPQGNYFVANLPFGTYTITPDNYTNSVLGTCATSIITTVNNSNMYANGNDFPMGYTSLTQPDVLVSAYTNGIVPGFDCYVNYSLCNLNNIPADGTYKVVFPPGFVSNITTVTPNNYIVSGDTLIWNYSNLSNNGCLDYTIHFMVPVSTPLGSTFTTCMLATTSIPDFDTANNKMCYDRIVTGAFDPNGKSVNPVGIGPSGNISTYDNELTYLIQFQNTGNGPAQTVYVTDTISPFLDITTFQMLKSSHDYDIEVVTGDIIKWTFYSIMLPDSTTDEPGSHGYIQYRIKQKPNSNLGSQIKNAAYIYFDFNEPVVTNTTLNTIDLSTSLANKQKNEGECIVYPNKTEGLITIQSSYEIKQIEVTTVAGAIILSEPVRAKTHQLQLQSFAEGIYFIKVIYSNGISVTKKVVRE